MNINQFLNHVNSGLPIQDDMEIHKYMNELSQEAMKITSELNGSYHTPEEIRKIFSKLIGKPVDKTFRMFPPFYTDCGKNINIGKNVFINSCCCFQDQGGITINDGSLIGHKVIFATLDHDFMPEKRGNTIPKPIVIGKNVWIGANATILSGVTIGDNSIIAAGAVVTKDVPSDSVAAGVPARVIKSIYDKSEE
ncbi:MAG: sugar O-acetyltransferase [Clostridiales bacterium]|nr:sugar O-acetyltransferase [Clostridiales bacterium]